MCIIKKLFKRKFARLSARIAPFFSLVLLVSCTRACVGIPEIGSQRTPVRLFLASRVPFEKTALMPISQCVEAYSHYKLQIEVAADEQAVVSALSRDEAHIAYLTPMNYVAASSKLGAVAHRVRLEAGAPANRAVIIGKRSNWQTYLSEQGLSFSVSGLQSENALDPIARGRFLFSDPDSDLGFFVPRHMLFLRNIFPEEAAFAGGDDMVAQGLARDLGIAGVVSEAWLRQTYNIEQVLQLGMAAGQFGVLALSQPLPGSVLVSKTDFSQKVLTAVLSGLDKCSTGEAQKEVAQVFGGESFGTVSERMFTYARELREIQETFLRVVEPQE
jgi:ABC-type phosphate/phosphonate transport system substrate-binding protein